MVRYMQVCTVLHPVEIGRPGSALCSEVSNLVVSVAAAAWRNGKLPHLSPRELSTAWQTEGPTNNQYQSRHPSRADADAAHGLLPPRLHNDSACLTPSPIQLPAAFHLSLPRCVPSICAIDPSPSCWTARCHQRRGWWHRVRLVRGAHDGGHRGKARGSCHLYG